MAREDCCLRAAVEEWSCSGFLSAPDKEGFLHNSPQNKDVPQP